MACTLGEVRRKLEHATESFCVKVQSKLAPYVDPILKTVRPQIQDLHYTLIARTLDLSTKLTEKLKQRLEELDHYTETLPSQWKEINEFLVPFCWSGAAAADASGADKPAHLAALHGPASGGR